jgi:nicotinamidase-related amidase
MMKIDFPCSGTKRALFVIDVQPQTLRGSEALATLAVLRDYVRATDYDAYVVATYSAPADSMFCLQSGWSLSAEAAGPSDPLLDDVIASKTHGAVQIAKTVRSVFKASEGDALRAMLSERGIDEIHLVGFDINDCVLATAYDALDSGFFTYVIEECTGRTDDNGAVIDAALTILRKQNMTNKTTRHKTLPIELG